MFSPLKLLYFLLLFLMPGFHPAFAAATVAISGQLVVGAPGQKVVLPDIVFTEDRPGVLPAETWIAVGGDYAAVVEFDVSGATLKAQRISDNSDVTGMIIGTNRLIADPAPSRTNLPDVVFRLAKASTPDNGPLRIVVSGLQAALGENSGREIYLKTGVAETGGAALDRFAKISGDPAGLAAVTLKAGTVLQACAGWCNPGTLTISGPLSAQTVFTDLIPHPDDQGKTGSVFVAVQLPRALGHGWLFLDKNGGWTPFSGCDGAKAYFSGALENLWEIPVVAQPADLTSLSGTQVVVGYGVSEAADQIVAACEAMLRNKTYQVKGEINWRYPGSSPAASLLVGEPLAALVGATATLPDIVVGEADYGVLRTDGDIGISGWRDAIAAFDVSRATLRIFRKSDHVDVTAAFLGGARLTAAAATSDTHPQMRFRLAKASSFDSGPLEIVISGVNASFKDAPQTEAWLSAGYAPEMTSGGVAASNEFGSARVAILSWPCAAGWCSEWNRLVQAGPATARTVSLAVFPVKREDLGKSAGIFVLAALPGPDKRWLVWNGDTRGTPFPAWSPMVFCDPVDSVFRSVVLNPQANFSLTPVPADLSGMAGSEIYTGYGFGTDFISACKEMLANGRWFRMGAIE